MARVEYNSNKDKNDIENREKEAQITSLEINNKLKKVMFYFVLSFLFLYTAISITIIFLYGFYFF